MVKPKRYLFPWARSTEHIVAPTGSRCLQQWIDIEATHWFRLIYPWFINHYQPSSINYIYVYIIIYIYIISSPISIHVSCFLPCCDLQATFPEWQSGCCHSADRPRFGPKRVAATPWKLPQHQTTMTMTAWQPRGARNVSRIPGGAGLPLGWVQWKKKNMGVEGETFLGNYSTVG